MSALDAGGPAFPVADPFAVKCPANEAEAQRLAMGMTLRDYFAAKAMQGFAADPQAAWKDGADGMARCAYAWADAMLKARAL